MIQINKVVQIWVLAILLMGCGKDEVVKNLITSPEQVEIGNLQLEISAYVWRDFMPGTNGNGSGLMCVLQLSDKVNQDIPTGFELKKLYVINGNEVWTTDFDEIRRDSKNRIEGVARNGPDWEVNRKVDVICEFKFEGLTYCLIAKSQTIEKTS